MAAVTRAEPGATLRSAGDHLTRGDLGPLPVIGALVVIAIVFGSLNDHFLSAENLTNLALQMAATGTISLGVIMVLLLGEIDLSVGSVSGLSTVLMTIFNVEHGLNPLLSVVLAIAIAAAIGLLHGLMFTKLGMPSFVVTLAGLIGWQGLLLYLLGKEGTINLPFDGAIAKMSDSWLSPALDSSVRFMVTAGVLALAVAIESPARKGRPGGAR
jgi:D-xylose transport system permease protein